MAAWPSTLPKALAEGYSIDPVDPVIRTEMEAGAVRARRRTTARNDRVSVSWLMTDAQFVIFRAWFDNANEAAGGSAWFTTNLNIGTGGVQSCSARFASKFKADYASPHWKVSATLEIR